MIDKGVIKIQVNPTIGSESSVILPFHPNRIMASHIHLQDFPPSPQDFLSLLIDQKYGLLGQIVVTPKILMLFMRTLKTPEKSQKEVQEWIENENKNLRLFSGILNQQQLAMTNARLVANTVNQFDIAAYSTNLTYERITDKEVYKAAF